MRLVAQKCAAFHSVAQNLANDAMYLLRSSMAFVLPIHAGAGCLHVVLEAGC